MVTCVLEKVVHRQNLYRFYIVSLEPTLFGMVALVRCWGRIGSPRGQRQETWFESEEQAMQAFARIIAAKRRKGYAEVSGSKRIHTPNPQDEEC
ncbi:MAG: WGR domain-containing protein [Rhodospirillaceae bacterium]|nr:MAG: WGR domain-containing protein [Rhodospirillaceae bacterium]